MYIGGKSFGMPFKVKYEMMFAGSSPEFLFIGIHVLSPLQNQIMHKVVFKHGTTWVTFYLVRLHIHNIHVHMVMLEHGVLRLDA
ncbi:hypothetical protein VTP01DRAFT_4343 [Rhizomucor pusillus]|uniref:uncharacterized protein n=1 Tax=Rhizomucor pusillus TaxID=4840 RepID=UPI0037427E57